MSKMDIGRNKFISFDPWTVSGFGYNFLFCVDNFSFSISSVSSRRPSGSTSIPSLSGFLMLNDVTPAFQILM